jgi:hypothetical protein
MAKEDKTLFPTSAPATYREMNQPFAGPEAAEAAVNGFYRELYDLRVKHRLADVYVAIRVPVDYGDSEGVVHAGAHIGDPFLAEAMTAWAFGYEQSQRQERTAEILSDSIKAVSKLKSRK